MFPLKLTHTYDHSDVGDNMLELCNVSRAQLYLAALPPNLLLWAQLCLPPTSIFTLKPCTPVPQDLTVFKSRLCKRGVCIHNGILFSH